MTKSALLPELAEPADFARRTAIKAPHEAGRYTRSRASPSARRVRSVMAEIVSTEVIEELLSLSDDGDPELLLDLIQMFLDDAPDRIASIGTALQSKDFEGIERAAHSLKGSAGNLGAVLLQGDCETMQNAGRHKVMAEAAECYPARSRSPGCDRRVDRATTWPTWPTRVGSAAAPHRR